MAIKKKWSILILLVGLFMVFCAFSSTCYALTHINQFTYDEFSQALDVIHDNLNYSANATSTKNYFNGFYNSQSNRLSAYSQLLGLLSGHVDYVEQLFFFYGQSGICFLVNNNTIGDTLPFPGLFNSSVFVFYSDASTTVDGYVVTITPNSPNGYFNISGSSTSAISYNPSIYPSFIDGKLFWGLWGCFHHPCSIYNNYVSPKGWTYISSLNVINPISTPDDGGSGEDSGESSGDTGGSGTITNPSGEVTGNIDLSGIENNLNNIENKIPTSGEIENFISGETGKIIGTLTDNPDLSNTSITSGDITDALNLDFAEDPYANFWLQLTTGLSGALTNNVRSINIQFRGKTYTISLDNFAIQVPQFLKSFLAILSTVFIFWKMVKYWKIIIDNISSGNMDEVIELNEEERNH